MLFLPVLFAILTLQTGIFCSTNEVKKSDKFSLTTLKDLQSTSRGSIIEFRSDLLKQFSHVDYKNRDYNLFIIFNALDKETNCESCSAAAAVFKQTTEVFNKKAKKGPLQSFFASIELKNNIEAFQMMGLDRVPVILHFGPGSREPKRLENFNPLDAGALLNFFVSQSGSEMNIHEALKPEPNYNNLIFFAAIALVLTGLIYTGVLSASSIFKNTYVWSVFIMSFIFVMLSGYMWVKIRNPPYTAGNGPQYFSPSPQSQLGAESRIITLLNAAVVIVFLLITTVTYKFDDNNKRRIAAMVMSILYMASHAALLKVFAQKFPGYPLSYIF